MTKKEKAELEALKLAASFYRTEAVEPDVEPPELLSDGLKTGFLCVGAKSEWARIKMACTSSIGHSSGNNDKTTSQGSRRLFSTRLRALKALRNEVENECMKRLRAVDRMVEIEKGGENG